MVSMAAVVSPHPRHRGHGGPRGRVPGELVVRLRPVKVVAGFDLTG